MKSFFGAGINDYAGTGSDLQGCVNDTLDWQEHFKCAHSQVLLNEQATKENVVKGIKDALVVLGTGDTALIQFSGHGSWVPDEDGDEPDGKDECLCTYDFRERVLVDDEIRGLLADRHPRSRVLFVTDSCHSGSVFRLAMSQFGEGNARIKFLPPHHFIPEARFVAAQRIAVRVPVTKSNQPLPGVIHFSGCRDFEYSYDAQFPGRANGAFTYFALQAYRECLTEFGAVTYRTWHQRISRYLPSVQYPQVPVFNATKAGKSWVVSNGGV